MEPGTSAGANRCLGHGGQAGARRRRARGTPQAEYVFQEAEAADHPAIRRSRQVEDTHAVELAREIERFVAIQRRLGILATDVLTSARECELS